MLSEHLNFIVLTTCRFCKTFHFRFFVYKNYVFLIPVAEVLRITDLFETNYIFRKNGQFLLRSIILIRQGDISFHTNIVSPVAMLYFRQGNIKN